MTKQEAIGYLQTLPDHAEVIVKTWSTEDVDRVLEELRIKSRIAPRIVSAFEKNDVLEDFAHRLKELSSAADRLLKASTIEILEETDEALLRVEHVMK